MREATEKPSLEEGEALKENAEASNKAFFNKEVGVNDAAKISRASKGQLSKDSNKNAISFTLDDKGHRRYKITDLYQKYGFRSQSEASNDLEGIHEEKPKESIENLVEVAVLKTKLEAKEDIIRRLEEENRDLKQNRDKQLEAVQRLTLLLSAPKSEPVIAPPPPLPQKQSFWKRLFP